MAKAIPIPTYRRFQDLTGLAFGRLTVLEAADPPWISLWKCVCSCGTEKVVRGGNLKNGSTRSCGCLGRESLANLAAGRIIDLTGARFTRLTVLHRVERQQKPQLWWRCRCDCGKEFDVRGTCLRNGANKSCGCYTRSRLGNASRTHGETANGGTVEYRAWRSMLQRCYDPGCKSYKNYGRRGIVVCERWRSSYEMFLSDMGRKPSPEMTIERTDNMKGYSPDNCRWATRKEQCRNQRTSRHLTWRGETRCMIEWAELLGLSSPIICKRLKRGWSISKALGTPRYQRNPQNCLT